MESQPVSRSALPQANGESPSQKYDGQKYDRIVTVPDVKLQATKPGFFYTVSEGRSGLRQPIEHPNDRTLDMQHGICEPSSGQLQNKSTHTPYYPPYRDERLLTSHSAMAQSQQRVQSWCISDGPSFFVDENAEDASSDDGLQKSLVGIQSPPDITSPSSCSRQSSSGSQSSLDSSFSFHTVCLSDASQRKSQHKKLEDISGFQHPPRTPMQYPIEHQQPTSMKPHATTSTEPYFGHSQSHPGGAHGVNRPSGQSGVRQINQNADAASREERGQKPTSVFITYAEEQQNGNFKRLVLQLTRTLLNNGIQVRLDMLESTLMSMSVNSWLDDNIQKCDFVIVCVSPSYKPEVEQPVLSGTPDPHSLHTRYIYNRLQTEYIQNGSRNYRFIPVLIGGATRRDLPSLCLDTTVYEWPRQYEAIIYRLFKKEKYIQPRVGPPPRCTIETYGSQADGMN